MHTGDLSHLSEAEEFDALEAKTLRQIATDRFSTCLASDVVLSDNGGSIESALSARKRRSGLALFRHERVHFVGLVYVVNIREGGLGIPSVRTISIG